MQKLLEQKNLQTISVSEIAQTSRIGKGSIYYYFSSKNAIFEALVKRNYKNPVQVVKTLAKQTEVAAFTPASSLEKAVLHQKYINPLITELKP